MKIGRLIILGVILVGAIGAIVFRDRISGNASDLAVGDCFEIPSGETVKDVQHHPCAEPHDAEVLVVAKYEGTDAYPTVSQFQTWVKQHCVDTNFTEYVGRSYESSTDLDVGWLSPTEEGWKGGDKEMTCYLTSVAGGMVTSSYRASAASAAP